MPTDYRIHEHPILPIPERNNLTIFWQKTALNAKEGETISAALFANNIRIFGHHPLDGSPQGIFCANGQCAQCMVLVDGKPVKACMELVRSGMKIEPFNSLSELPTPKDTPAFHPIAEISIPVLILGGGPAGLSAAIELGKLGVKTILVDDKHRLGGKLVLQTHRFFGSTHAVYAGTRGIDIATRLEKEMHTFSSVETWLHSTALAVFSDQKVGVLRETGEYILVKPEVLLVATGAREKFLAFQGNSLPGVYGAGAFQTLVNRDLVRPAGRLFIVGGGNVGLIAGYHALQAGIDVVGLVEALPECGGYKVHKDKLVRMGVPVYTSHTILSANGRDYVESVTIAKVDEGFRPIAGTERSFACDSVLIAVGLDPVDEFFHKAKEFGMAVYAAGDAEEIAEASAAMFSGKIKGREIACYLGCTTEKPPYEWYRTVEILKSKPGQSIPEELPEITAGAMPILHCTQEIPCDPCSNLCPHGLISINEKNIRSLPDFLGNNYCCAVCEKCVAGCPGLAITLVDSRNNPEFPVVSIPYEFSRGHVNPNDRITVLDTEGHPLGDLEILDVKKIKAFDRTLILHVQAPKEYAVAIAGVRVQNENAVQVEVEEKVPPSGAIICRCERVGEDEIRRLIHAGYRDLNEIKAVCRAGMGACGGKTCTNLIYRIFKEEGIQITETTAPTKRPLFIEAPLGTFAGIPKEDDHDR